MEAAEALGQQVFDTSAADVIRGITQQDVDLMAREDDASRRIDDHGRIRYVLKGVAEQLGS